MESRIREVYAYLEKFFYLSGCFVEKGALGLTDHLNSFLQRCSFLAVEGQEITYCVVTRSLWKNTFIVVELSYGVKQGNRRLLQSLFYLENHHTIVTVIPIFIMIPDLFITSTILTLLTKSLKIY